MDIPWFVRPNLSRWGSLLLFTLLILFVLVIGYLHYLVGMAYEFYLLFLMPMLCVSWYFSRNAAYSVVVFILIVWGVGDALLMGGIPDKSSLIFNSVVRLIVFLSAARLLMLLRALFDRESKFAREDGLTGLLNRREFYELGERVLASANRQSIPVSIVFVDVDKFKEINDSFGHDTGDRLLTLVANTMKTSVRSTDVVGRVGGDEFALILPDLNGGSALAFVEKLQNALLDVMKTEQWPATFSIGIASFQKSPKHLEAAVTKADSLMYCVKRSGRNKITQQIYTDS